MQYNSSNKESKNTRRKTYLVLDRMLKLLYNSFSEWKNKEKIMYAEIALFFFCIIGCGLTCHALGKREGMETTIEHLVSQGLLHLDEE